MKGAGARQAYESVFAHSLDGILFSSPDGRILAANPAACAILRLSDDDICRRGRGGLADPTDPRWGVGVELRRRTGRFRGELRMIRGDGTPFEADVSSSVFTGADGTERACVIFRDVTEHAALVAEQRRLAAERHLLAQLERVAADVQGIVAHRLLGVGLSLQAVHNLLPDEPLARRVADVIAEVDAIVRDVRTAVFSVRHGAPSEWLRDEVEGAVADARRDLGVVPTVRFEGAVESVVAPAALEEVRGVLRAALAAAATEPATEASVVIDVRDHELAVTVAHDAHGEPRVATWTVPIAAG